MPNFVRQAISNNGALVAVKFEPPMKRGFVERNKSVDSASSAAAALWALKIVPTR